MFEYPIEKYQFYVNENKRQVIAVSTYAGRTVRGIAKCHEHDEFDVERGKRLAAARCNKKIAEKRLARAKRKMATAHEMMEDTKKYYERMFNYQFDAEQASKNADANLALIENEI